MSLIQHVSSIDGVDRDRPETPARPSVRRVISYDAFPKSADEDGQPSVAAYKVSATKRMGR